MISNKSLLLVITGSIAAYKSLELIRRLRERGWVVNTILTKSGEQFITPLSVASLTGTGVYTDLFSLKDETEMGHIRLSRESDIVLVAPASANIIAKMVSGIADDLATTALLATDKPVIVAPAMNSKMWEHPATQRNIKQLVADGVRIIAPSEGSLACGETGSGRLAEVDDIIHYIENISGGGKPLAGLRALVTSGPTYEPLDPVRFIGNRSSGRQGLAIADALKEQGAQVTLVTGPTSLASLPGITTIKVETAEEMLVACEKSLPADIAICAAAVADWKPQFHSERKLKKRGNQTPPTIALKENPDILLRLSQHPTKRPHLVIGFAAETEQLKKNAVEKRIRKGCDWLLANDVSHNKVFGEEENEILFLTESKAESWPRMDKREVASELASRIAQLFQQQKNGTHNGNRKRKAATTRK